MTNPILYARIQEEFDEITNSFIEKEKLILSDESLITIQSKYNLHEIEPYYAQLNNQVIPPDAKLRIETSDDFNPETDDLFEYRISLENRKPSLKIQHYGDRVGYFTLYEYTEEYHKSFTIYQNKESIKATNVSYLYFKNGMPERFIECTEYGISVKTYTCDEDFIKSYKLEWQNHDHYCTGELKFDHEGKIIQITETASDGRIRIIYDSMAADKDIEEVLADLENFLVENIADQIIEKVRITEPVYCILFEYTMQGPFPPTIAFGAASEITGNFEDQELYQLYNAPDMQYFSEGDEDDVIPIDLYPIAIQPDYLATDTYGENISWEDEEATNKWEQQVFDTYLKVCKRLMHFDFSKSFPKTEHFLVMARDFEACNEDKFYKELQRYKKENFNS
ncbi:hypothetical protein [Flavobacterium sp. HTF]|uniref:hypothetical protein n=1 Tax=Flavobacterium sp. HTF TaxID=2170732 RepID=UPI000D5FC468|nr:hypothetical protein [Flavobacterium sp. HTF]PWB27642.1 hypothetical protein DCO46_02485 [Flavobacterium sp. HTF]